jgi:hypothetical protein
MKIRRGAVSAPLRAVSAVLRPQALRTAGFALRRIRQPAVPSFPPRAPRRSGAPESLSSASGISLPRLSSASGISLPRLPAALPVSLRTGPDAGRPRREEGPGASARSRQGSPNPPVPSGFARDGPDRFKIPLPAPARSFFPQSRFAPPYSSRTFRFQVPPRSRARVRAGTAGFAGPAEAAVQFDLIAAFRPAEGFQAPEGRRNFAALRPGRSLPFRAPRARASAFPSASGAFRGFGPPPDFRRFHGIRADQGKGVTGRRVFRAGVRWPRLSVSPSVSAGMGQAAPPACSGAARARSWCPKGGVRRVRGALPGGSQTPFRPAVRP